MPGRQRPPQQVALHPVAAQGPGGRPLVRGLHPFGHHRHAQVVRQRHQRLDDGRAVGVVRQATRDGQLRGRILAASRGQAGAHVAAGLQDARAQLQRLGQLGQQPAGHLGQRRRVGDLVERHGERVAAQPGQAVGPAQQRRQVRGRHLLQRAARVLAQQVVDELEAVAVGLRIAAEAHRSRRRIRARRAVDDVAQRAQSATDATRSAVRRSGWALSRPSAGWPSGANSRAAGGGARPP